MSISRDKRQGKVHTLGMLSGIAACAAYSGLSADAGQQKGGLRAHEAFGNSEFTQPEEAIRHPSSSRNLPAGSCAVRDPAVVKATEVSIARL